MANGHGSDVQVTPEWWMASDGRWYPPQLHPDYVPPAAPVQPAPAAQPPVSQPPAAQPPVQQPPINEPRGVIDALTTKGEVPSLAERLRSAADQVGDSASAAADQIGGAEATTRATMPGAGSGATSAADLAGGAAAGFPGSDELLGEARSTLGIDADAGVATPPAVPSSPPPVSRPTVSPSAPGIGGPPPVPGSPPAIPSRLPAVKPPSQPAPMSPPPMPGAPAASPPAVPPMARPPAMPPSAPPQPIAPAPGPGVAPSAPPPSFSTSAPPPSAPAPAPAAPQPAAAPPVPYQSPADAAIVDAEIVERPNPKSPAAGMLALVGGAAALAGSFLQWGKGDVVGADGVQKALIEVAGFDSNGMITAICGGVLVVLSLLFFTGVPRQLFWAVLAFIAGAAIVGLAVFSTLDIIDLSDRYAQRWRDEGASAVGDVVTTQTDLGLWIAGAGGILGVLAAPFFNRSNPGENL